jgi:hypothetical protein
VIERREIIEKIDALADEALAAGQGAASAVLRALVGAMHARAEGELRDHVAQFSWRLLKRVMATRN